LSKKSPLNPFSKGGQKEEGFSADEIKVLPNRTPGYYAKIVNQC
jgi:hypothetical protein